MKNVRHGKYLLALVALVLVFAGCRGESVTAPPLGSPPGEGPGGGVPPTGATIVLTVVNPNPQAGSSTEIRATVTVNNQPVPNGTAVEFSTTFGVFQEPDPDSPITIRTTTGGVATATLTATAQGTATVRAVVSNVSQTTTVVFSARPVTPEPPTPTTPSIISVTPIIAPPTGGTVVTIRGRNFRPPVKVFFDFGNGVLREALVIAQTADTIQLFTPQVDLGAGQTTTASIIVFFEQGTPAETSVTFPTPFTFQRAILTPIMRGISPASGPIDGGTRVTIFGEGFEHPLQLFFGAAEAQVINVTFSQIIAIAPPGRDTSPDGSTPVTGPISLRVVNINSGTEGTLADGFRYTPKMVITAAGPTTGTALGGTRVRIDGTGFDQPVAVEIGGIAAQPVSVSGTQIIAVTSPTASPCAGSSGPIRVINIDNGDFAEGPEFTFIGVNPIITGIAPAGGVTPGGTVTVTVTDPGIGPLGSAVIRFQVGTTTVIPSPPTISVGTGSQTFTVVVPTTGFTFPTIACTTAAGTPGTQLGPIDVAITFTNVTTGCTDTIPNGLRINPPGPNTCLAPPTASISPAAPACANAPPAVSAGAATSTTTVTVSNAPSSRDLTVTPSVTCTNATCTISSSTGPIAGGTSQTFTVTVDPNCPAPGPPCAVTGTASFATNDPARATITACITGSGI
jgi:hypothetical protein